VLCCTPTYALHLAEVAEKEGIDPGETGLEKIIVAGEPGGGIPRCAHSHPGTVERSGRSSITMA
jgi:hypothetical protein